MRTFSPIMRPMKTHAPFPKWKEIEETAILLGVCREALRKWRVRGIVPHRWRIPIMQARVGVFVPDDFDATPAGRRT